MNMDERISNFIKLKDRLSLVSQYCRGYSDHSKAKKRLEVRLNEAVKTLSAEEFAGIVKADLQRCVDNKTANPLLWICGLDLNELPKGTTFEAEYSPNVRIGVGADDKGLHLSVRTTGKEGVLSDCCFSLNDMGSKFLDILETAKAAKVKFEDKEMAKEVSDFIELKEWLTEASQYDLYCRDYDWSEWNISYEVSKDLRAQVNRALKNLPTDKLAEIIKADLQACVDNKTATPLLWICGLDLDELPKGTFFEVKCSPDVGIHLIIDHEHGDGYLAVKTPAGYVFDCSLPYNDLKEMKYVFLSALETVEHEMRYYAEEMNKGGEGEKLKEIEEPTNKELGRINAFIALKEQLSEANHNCLYTWCVIDRRDWKGSDEARKHLETQLREAIETLSEDEFAEIIRTDLQACIDSKTVEPLLWMCGLSPKELPIDAVLDAKYSPDIRIRIEDFPEDKESKGKIFLSVETDKKFLYCEHINRFNAKVVFPHLLEMTDYIEKNILDENEKGLTDEELEYEKVEEDKDHDDPDEYDSGDIDYDDDYR